MTLPDRTARNDPAPAASTATTLSFADFDLPAPLVSALARAGLTSPFPIQAATLPDALAGRDVLGRGRTGSGKTLAFGLPALARLSRPGAGRRRPREPRALVLVPTRELAMQVHDALEPLAHTLRLRLKAVVGGASMPRQISALEQGVDLLVATPGRLADLIERRAAGLGAVEITVVDEADHMADMGFLPAVTALLDLTPDGGQRLLFSATLDGDVDTLVRRYLHDPVRHSTDPATASVSTMSHHVLHVDATAKADVTAHIAARDGRTILFVRTKHGVDRLATQLQRRGVVTGALHGGKTQNARNRALAAFREGRAPVLVTTDVAARGIHVDDVSLVLNVDPPSDHKDYLHRAGRTARAGDSGAVVTLALPSQRREVEALTRRAGVSATRLAASAGDQRLAALTGARAPSGVPVQAPVDPPAYRGEPGYRRGSDATGQQPSGRGSRRTVPRQGTRAGAGGKVRDQRTRAGAAQ